MFNILDRAFNEGETNILSVLLKGEKNFSNIESFCVKILFVKVCIQVKNGVSRYDQLL